MVQYACEQIHYLFIYLFISGQWPMHLHSFSFGAFCHSLACVLMVYVSRTSVLLWTDHGFGRKIQPFGKVDVLGEHMHQPGRRDVAGGAMRHVCWC